MTTSELRVAECGAATAFAPSLSESFAALARHETALFRNETFFDRAYQPQLCAFRENIGISTFEERLKALAVEALQDLTNRQFAKNPQSVALDVDLVIVLPEEAAAEGLGRERLTSLGRHLSDVAEQQLLGRSGLRIQSARLFCGGNSGVGFVLADYLGTHSAQRVPDVLLLALDSYNDRQRLTACNNDNRLYSRANRYGFIPGEAGSAFLVTSKSTAKPSVGDVCLTGAATATERIKQYDEGESAFSALSDCCFQAVEQPGSSHDLKISTWLADWDNSRYRAGELSLALHRLGHDHMIHGLEPIYPAIDFGNVGAAFGALALARIFEQAQENTLNSLPLDSEGERARKLVSAGSTFSGLRSAFVVEAIEVAQKTA